MQATSFEAPAALVDRLNRFSHGALKKIFQTLRVADVNREGYPAALATFLGTPGHRAILERELSSDEWALLTLLPLQLRAFALRERNQVLDAIFATVGRLFALGCFVPSEAAGQVLPGVGRLGIEASALRGPVLNLWFDLSSGVGQWARERNPTSLDLAPVEPPSAVVESRYPELQRALFILLSEAARKPIRITTMSTSYR